MLAQEPWCYTPEQIARLTDWHILNLYAKPAIERSKQFAKPGAPSAGLPPRAHGESASTGPPGEPGSPEHRSACVGAYIDVRGLSPEQAAAQYDRQLAKWHAQQGTKP